MSYKNALFVMLGPKEPYLFWVDESTKAKEICEKALRWLATNDVETDAESSGNMSIGK